MAETLMINREAAASQPPTAPSDEPPRAIEKAGVTVLVRAETYRQAAALTDYLRRRGLQAEVAAE